MVSSGEKSYKYFIGYAHNENKWMSFWVEDDDLPKNIMIFGIK